jgi:hypothetical protein
MYSGLSDDITTDDYVQVINVEDPLGSPVFTSQFINLGDIDPVAAALADAPQPDNGLPGSPDDIEVNDRRTLNAVWRNDNLWISTTITPSSGTDAGETTAHWIKLDTSTLSLITLADQGSIGGEDIATGTYTYFPSIAVNENEEVAIGFSASAPTVYAGAYFVTREAGDSAGTTSSSQTVKTGVDTYVRTFGGGRNRWGDYSGSAVDPFDGCLWVYNQWADTRAFSRPDTENGRWGTAYARTCACNATSPELPANQWSMVSMACDTGQNTVADLLPTLIPGDYGTTWAVYERDAANNQYLIKSTTDTLEEGRGYWIYTDQTGITLDLEGMYNSGADIPLDEAADGRMNLVGYPHSATINWADIIILDDDGVTELSLDDVDPDQGGVLACEQPGGPAAECIMSRKMYQWTGAAYQTYDGITPGMEGSLGEFDALWVEAFKAGIALRFPGGSAAAASATPEPTSSTSLTTASTANEPSRKATDVSAKAYREGDPWYMRLTVESGELKDEGNVLGQLADSVDGKDIHDLNEKEPFGGTYLTIVFPHEEWGTDAWGYTSDYRALTRKPRGEWRFAVKASPNVSSAVLSWQADDAILRKARLVDEKTGRRVKMKADGSYTFNISGGVHYFRLSL